MDENGTSVYGDIFIEDSKSCYDLIILFAYLSINLTFNRGVDHFVTLLFIGVIFLVYGIRTIFVPVLYCTVLYCTVLYCTDTALYHI